MSSFCICDHGSGRPEPSLAHWTCRNGQVPGVHLLCAGQAPGGRGEARPEAGGRQTLTSPALPSDPRDILPARLAGPCPWEASAVASSHTQYPYTARSGVWKPRVCLSTGREGLGLCSFSPGCVHAGCSVSRHCCGVWSPAPWGPRPPPCLCYCTAWMLLLKQRLQRRRRPRREG